MNNKIILHVQLACTDLHGIPEINKIELWVQTIFSFHIKTNVELTIRIVDIQEMMYLNWYYLNKNYPTNVLSFPLNTPIGIQSLLLGDIVICKKIVEYEIYQHQNNISFPDIHWAHIITHGSLHLLGYNHITDEETELMNQIELNMIRKFGYKTCCSLTHT